MRLDASDFEAVWQHLCARALADHAQGTLIASFVNGVTGRSDDDRSYCRHERPYGLERVLGRAPSAPTPVSSTAAPIIGRGRHVDESLGWEGQAVDADDALRLHAPLA